MNGGSRILFVQLTVDLVIQQFLAHEECQISEIAGLLTVHKICCINIYLVNLTL